MSSEKEVMLGVPEEDMVELQEHRAMVELPENAVEVNINVKVYSGGKVLDVCKNLSLNDIREAFQKADDGYIDDNDRFVITEEGLKWLEERE